MTPGARVKYHRDLWPAACRAQGWNHRDTDLRRKVCLECMSLVGGPRCTTSDPRFAADETTALFTYLLFLADQASLDKAAAWSDCMLDYRMFNRARNSDWHERETYGVEGSRKLQRNRFSRRKTAAGEPLDPFDPEEIRKRHLTTATRHRAKAKAVRETPPAPPAFVPGRGVPPPDSVILLPPPAEVYAPDPAYVPPDNGDPF